MNSVSTAAWEAYSPAAMRSFLVQASNRPSAATAGSPMCTPPGDGLVGGEGLPAVGLAEEEVALGVATMMSGFFEQPATTSSAATAAATTIPRRRAFPLGRDTAGTVSPCDRDTKARLQFPAVGMALLLLFAGGVLLFMGAGSAIRGASGFARAAGVPLFTLGALLFGIDFEGLGTAIVAAAKGQTALAAGEVFGTLAFLYGGALAVALLVARRPVASPGAEMVLAPAAALFSVAVVASDTEVSRVALLTVAGLGALYGGATFLVLGGVRVLERTQLAPGFIGAALVGVLVSLDEVVLEVLPIRRGQDDLATGNLFGTVAAFCTAVIGVAALVRPLDLDGAGMATLIFATALYAFVATVFLLRDRVGWIVGAVLLASYLGWLVLAASF